MQNAPLSSDQIPFVYAIALFAWGACTGSLLNVVILRLPTGQSLVEPPSHCPACGTRVRLIDLVPILNWFWLRGRCRACKASIHWRYPLIEFMTAACCAWIAFNLSDNSFGIYQNVGILMTTLIACCLMLAMLVIDLDRSRFPASLPLLGLLARLATAAWLPSGWVRFTGGLSTAGVESLALSLYGALIGGGTLLVLRQVLCHGARSPNSTSGRGPSIRIDDILFAAFAGSLFGWAEVLLLIGCSTTAFLVVQLVNRWRGSVGVGRLGTILVVLALLWILFADMMLFRAVANALG